LLADEKEGGKSLASRFDGSWNVHIIRLKEEKKGLYFPGWKKGCSNSGKDLGSRPRKGEGKGKRWL